MATSPFSLPFLFSLLLSPASHACCNSQGVRLPVETLPPGGSGGVLGNPPPSVHETSTRITIVFPGTASLEMGKQKNRVLGIRWLKLNGRLVYSMGTEFVPPPVIELVDRCPYPPLEEKGRPRQSWVDHLARRASNRGYWAPLGPCRTQLLALEKAQYKGSKIDGNTVSLQFLTPRGTVYWVFEGRTSLIGGQSFGGLGWSLEVSPGMENVVWAYYQEPLPLGQDFWYLAQNWGNFQEEALTKGTTFRLHPNMAWGYLQPFLFLAGKQGALLGWLEKPDPFQVEIQKMGPRLVRSLALPFGPGPHRSTPVKYWQFSSHSYADKWARLNAWTRAYDALASFYRAETGIQEGSPKPTYLWGIPSAQFYLNLLQWKKGLLKNPPKPWLQTFRTKELLELAKLWIPLVYLQSPWHSDLEHLKADRFLPTRHDSRVPKLEDLGSGHAPWEAEISKSIGGVPELKRLVQQAHLQGQKVILWTNLAHLSISSPRLLQNPDWAMWRKEGVPNDEGYGDITGMDLFGGYFDELLGGLTRVHRQTGFDGVWLDSFLTFGLAIDYRRHAPRSQMTRTLEMMKRIQKMGLSELYIEGVSLLGISTGGYGYEGTYYGGTPDKGEWARYLAIRGREYGLYHYVTDTFLEVKSYYRALASKGVIALFKLSQLQELEKKVPGAREDIRRSNFEYLSVLPYMQHRLLLGTGSLWQGVAWTHDRGKEIALFSFVPFDFPVTGSMKVRDLTEGRSYVVKGKLQTKEWHTYLLKP